MEKNIFYLRQLIDELIVHIQKNAFRLYLWCILKLTNFSRSEAGWFY
jgi:hypothetical protein